jgi:hypothetical protein
MKKITFILVNCFVAFTFSAYGQFNAINTAVSFLGISPSTRGASMADIGIATPIDPSSAYWNPGKLMMADNYSGVTASHAPWMPALIQGLSLTSIYAYLAPFEADQTIQMFGAGLRYFSRGDITYMDVNGAEVGTYRPADLAVDLTYSRQIGDGEGLGLTFRVISSSLGSSYVYADHSPVKTGMAFAIDLGYYKNIITGERESNSLAFGAVIQNLGSKLKYTTDGSGTFLPTTLKLGTNYSIGNDPGAVIYSIGVELNKLLVPTPPLYDENGDISSGKNPDVSMSRGIVQSFYDAPGGFKEELNEVQLSFGAEAAFHDHYFLRGGLAYESKFKGNRSYGTIGVGYKMYLSSNQVQFDGGYLVPFDPTSPLKNSVRFSISVFVDRK